MRPSARIALAAERLGLGADASLGGLLTIGAWGVWMWRQGGHEASSWSPVGVFLLLLLALVLLLGPRVAELTAPRRVVLACLGAFVCWNYLSLLWADAPGDAWIGADKTLLYALGFSIFFLWRWADSTALTFLGAYVLVVASLGGLWLAEAAASSATLRYFEDGRALGPIGYVNGSAALWTMALWPAAFLAGCPRVHVALRALFLACATLLAELALLGQSRGWLAVLPVGIALFLLLARQRLRALLAITLVCLCAAAVHRNLLDVFEQWEHGAPIGGAVQAAAWSAALGCALAAAAGLGWGLADRAVRLSPAAHRLAAAAVTVVVVAGLAVAAVQAGRAVGDPGTWVSERWRSFTCVDCPSDRTGSRFTGTLSNDRYREWRVAWGQFTDSPVLGAGADNYLGAYLESRTDDLYEPKYPHSTPLRLLGQLGLVGTLLFAAAFAAAAMLALRVRRTADAATGGAVAAALTVVGYWLVYGSIDFFWELPALAAPAFGLLGLAASVAPAAERVPTTAPRRTRLVLAAAATTTAVLVVAVAAPGLAAAYERAALQSWRQHPSAADARFDRAAWFDPLSARPLLLKGGVALLAGDGRRAETAFRAALRREPKNWYAYLQLALLAGSRSDYDRAERLIAHARDLNPRDRVAAVADRVIQRRIPVTPSSVNALFLRKERARFLPVRQDARDELLGSRLRVTP